MPLPPSSLPVVQPSSLLRVVVTAGVALVGGAYLLGSLQRFLAGGRRGGSRGASRAAAAFAGSAGSEENRPFAPPADDAGPGFGAAILIRPRRRTPPRPPRHFAPRRVPPAPHRPAARRMATATHR